ncbi:hypothetical protein [Cellulomonas sp. Marseille-Q8402]
MSRRLVWCVAAGGAVVSALAAVWLALGALLRHEGAAWVTVLPQGQVAGDGALDVVPAVALAHVVGFGSRGDALLSRAAVWLPFVLAAVVLAGVAWQVGRRRGRLAWTDVLEPRGSQVWLAVALAAAGVLPGLARTLAGRAVLRAAGSPDGYAALPVTVDWGWLVAAGLLLVGRAAVARVRAGAREAALAG